jgi:hypothetical protein
VLEEALLAGALLEPLAALLLSFGWSALVLELELDAPPDAVDGVLGGALEELVELSFFFDASIDTEPEVEPGVVEPDDEELAEPEGAAGVVVPDDEEVDEPGAVRVTVRSPSLSQPVNSPAPSARETAIARVESFM